VLPDQYGSADYRAHHVAEKRIRLDIQSHVAGTRLAARPLTFVHLSPGTPCLIILGSVRPKCGEVVPAEQHLASLVHGYHVEGFLHMD